MATATSKLTNVQALTALIEFAEVNGYENEEVLGKMRRHLEVISKPSKKSDTPTKTQLLNASLADKVAAYLASKPGEMVSPKSVMENLGDPNVCSSQKATILLGILVKDGRAVKHNVSGRALFSAANC